MMKVVYSEGRHVVLVPVVVVVVLISLDIYMSVYMRVWGFWDLK